MNMVEVSGGDDDDRESNCDNLNDNDNNVGRNQVTVTLNTYFHK